MNSFGLDENHRAYACVMLFGLHAYTARNKSFEPLGLIASDHLVSAHCTTYDYETT